jgi:hypothetical protein
MKMM